MQTEVLPGFINVAVAGTLDKNNSDEWWGKPGWGALKGEIEERSQAVQSSL